MLCMKCLHVECKVCANFHIQLQRAQIILLSFMAPPFNLAWDTAIYCGILNHVDGTCHMRPVQLFIAFTLMHMHALSTGIGIVRWMFNWVWVAMASQWCGMGWSGLDALCQSNDDVGLCVYAWDYSWDTQCHHSFARPMMARRASNAVELKHQPFCFCRCLNHNDWVIRLFYLVENCMRTTSQVNCYRNGYAWGNGLNASPVTSSLLLIN